MSHSVEHEIETEGRERTMLRYEAIFWGAAFVALAAVAVYSVLIIGGVAGIIAGAASAAGAVFSYIERDSTREEYKLKVGSGQTKLSARHYADEFEMGKGATRGMQGSQIAPTKDIPVNPGLAPTDSALANIQTNLTREQQERIENDEDRREAQSNIIARDKSSVPSPIPSPIETAADKLAPTKPEHTQPTSRADGQSWSKFTAATQNAAVESTLSK